jgi:hypothetical protein
LNKKNSSNSIEESHESIQNDAESEDEVQAKHDLNENNFSGEQIKALKERIESVSFPGVTLRQIVVTCLFLGGYLIPILALLFIFPTIQTQNENHFLFSKHLDLLIF